MNKRFFPVVVLSFGLLVSLVLLARIPSGSWGINPLTEAIFILYLLVTFSLILVAYWVYEDGKKLDQVERTIMRKVERRLRDLNILSDSYTPKASGEY